MINFCCFADRRLSCYSSDRRGWPTRPDRRQSTKIVPLKLYHLAWPWSICEIIFLSTYSRHLYNVIWERPKCGVPVVILITNVLKLSVFPAEKIDNGAQFLFSQTLIAWGYWLCTQTGIIMVGTPDPDYMQMNSLARLSTLDLLILYNMTKMADYEVSRLFRRALVWVPDPLTCLV